MKKCLLSGTQSSARFSKTSNVDMNGIFEMKFKRVILLLQMHFLGHYFRWSWLLITSHTACIAAHVIVEAKWCLKIAGIKYQYINTALHLKMLHVVCMHARDKKFINTSLPHKKSLTASQQSHRVLIILAFSKASLFVQ